MVSLAVVGCVCFISGVASGLPVDGVYAVRNVNSGKVLNVEQNGLDNGSNVWQWDNPENPSSQWYLALVGDDTYTLTNVNSGKCLNVESDGLDNGANVWQWDNPTNPSSQWRLNSVIGEIYTLTNVHSGKALNVQENSKDNGGNIWQWDNPENPSSQWYLSGVQMTTTPAPSPAPTPSPPVPTPPAPSPTPPGAWDGWGTSLAWWAKLFGDRDDVADAMFSCKDHVSVWGRYDVPGLCLNIARYNAGGSAWRSFDGKSMVASPHIPGYRQIEGFWQDSHSDDPASSSWDWSVDLKQRTAMQKARERGADRFELFSNSPMWWMLKNHNPSGASDGGDNLEESQYENHAKYLATIAAYARDHWNITFDSVEPMNEASSDWWKASNNQEGCHFGLGLSQARIVRALRTELDNLGLTSIVAASDENSAGLELGSWAALGAAGATQYVGGVNFHGYIHSGDDVEIPVRVGLAAGTQGKRLWNTEYGDDDTSGQSLAREISLDMNWAKPTAWHHWQAVDGSGWGLLALGGNNDIVGVNQKYYVLAQHSRHIKSGMQILESNHNHTIMAYDSSHKRLVIVTSNHHEEQSFTYNLSQFDSVQGPVARWVTEFHGDQRYRKQSGGELSSINLSQKTLSVVLPALTIQTFEIENVVMSTGVFV